MNDPVPIGRGLARLNVRSKAKRARLATVPGVRIESDGRVIMPEWMGASIAMMARTKKRAKRAKQTEIWEKP
jgi:hypothetical protein